MRHKARDSRLFRKPLVTTLIVFLIVIALVEGSLRILGLGDPPIAIRDTELEYRLVPNRKYKRWGNRIEINSHGFRAADHSVDRPPSEARLLLIGDSVIYGNHFLDQEDTIAWRLSEILSTPTCFVRVIPMAVSSWGPINQAAALERHGSFDADEIAIILSGHDLFDTPQYSGTFVPYRLTKPKTAIGDFITALTERYFPTSSVDLGPSFEDRAQSSLEALNQIKTLSDTADANLLFVYHATTQESASGVSQSGQRLLDWAELNGMRRLDLSNTANITYRDHIHPDAAGALKIAQALSVAYAETFSCPIAN